MRFHSFSEIISYYSKNDNPAFLYDEDGEKKPRKAKTQKVDEEPTEWNDDASATVSIADLLNKNA